MTEIESETLDLDVKEESFSCELTEESEFSVNFGESAAGGDVPIATDKILGKIRVGENLKITPEGILSVDTAQAVEQDNTKPITSAAVHMEIGNIELLLSQI